MSRGLTRLARLLAAPTLALLVVVVFLPGWAENAIRIYALVFAGLVVVVALAALRRTYPPTTPLRPERQGRSEPPMRPPTLARLEKETALGVAGSFDLHYRLRPRLRAVAAARLSVRRGISLDGEPDAARAALGDVAWELVRRDRPAPDDRLASGIPPAVLTQVVDSLERL